MCLGSKNMNRTSALPTNFQELTQVINQERRLRTPAQMLQLLHAGATSELAESYSNSMGQCNDPASSAYHTSQCSLQSFQHRNNSHVPGYQQRGSRHGDTLKLHLQKLQIQDMKIHNNDNEPKNCSQYWQHPIYLVTLKGHRNNYNLTI